MKKGQDAYGQQLLAQYFSREATAEIIERDDNYIDTGSDAGTYFSEYRQWSPLEKRAVKLAKGRVLDVGCGAGRHALYLQERGFDVTGIDNSPGAIKVCKLRGLKKAFVRPIDEIDKFKPNSFDTIQMFGNNFGLFGSRENAGKILEKMTRITSPEARIIAKTFDPYQTDNPLHLLYLQANKRRGRMGGQIRMRVRFGKTVGEWFDYLFVSPEEMREIMRGSDWQIEEFLDAEDANYIVIIKKKSSDKFVKQPARGSAKDKF
ncbi:MAG: class I SAM-dependent methyltransferase [Pyrinomonadaceae bacterium]